MCRGALARTSKLTEDIRRDPFTGMGRPESLKRHLPGAWSRHIDDGHRLVCVATGRGTVVTAARHHY
ncbi:Txe/YoeB family addiction module toxin [Nocardiopsis alborubida]|uniref:Endoribonuclease YoeB n=1 Tax=Nocardiopsis alborubida TaxID=146802 RepID=A0A7X6MER5_9ACTN|nr:Txe/YoeB family addiction module toxin [Nocardiopsis alborubida]NKY99921.1 Txe/YoeB family addiction module toxin [Nocardiopsis alborubida]